MCGVGDTRRPPREMHARSLITYSARSVAGSAATVDLSCQHVHFAHVKLTWSSSTYGEPLTGMQKSRRLGLPRPLTRARLHAARVSLFRLFRPFVSLQRQALCPRKG